MASKQAREKFVRVLVESLDGKYLPLIHKALEEYENSTRMPLSQRHPTVHLLIKELRAWIGDAGQDWNEEEMLALRQTRDQERETREASNRGWRRTKPVRWADICRVAEMIGAWVPKSYRNFGLMKIIDKQIEAGKVIKIERGLYRLAD